MQGAEVFLVDGLIDDCGRLVAEGEKAVGWFNCSTLREPYRIEGKKTMGLELAEQLGWEVAGRDLLPDRRRHRHHRHVEGLRRTREDRLDRAEAAAHGRGPGGRLRADGQGLGGRRRARAALGKRAHLRRRHPGAAGDRRLSDPARGARERRVRDRRRRRRDRRAPGARWRKPKGCCSAPRARRPTPPTSRRWPTAGCAPASASCCSTAPPASNTRCPKPDGA